MKEEQKGELILYQAEDETTKIEVRLENENVWLTQKMMAELFQTTPQNITIHLKNIFDEGELQEDATCKDFLQVQNEGSRKVERRQKFYNLDAIISVGYRIKSHIATKFRIWATARLKEYLIKGFTMDDERLKNLGGGIYWKELLDRIRDIRSSEKVLYRQVLDLYATSADYDPNSEESIRFFKIVQNKLHYAAHGHTAAEIIAKRADAGKPFMGLLTFSGGEVTRKDIGIAKNYLSGNELKKLNNIVSAYFDLAEVKALNQEPMYMKNWIAQLDRLIQTFDGKLLNDAGSVSHEQAMKRVETEYRKYQSATISAVEQAYLETLEKAEKKVKKSRKIKKPGSESGKSS
ncbi:virulence RhuM family protein [Fidelibacter multiformis]|uniref:virulence RhuM family protein n=1 Tax=Fidelibacter multiformis TaxID=3377529 RepID=UPI0037DCD5A4